MPIFFTAPKVVEVQPLGVVGWSLDRGGAWGRSSVTPAGVESLSGEKLSRHAEAFQLHPLNCPPISGGQTRRNGAHERNVCFWGGEDIQEITNLKDRRERGNSQSVHLYGEFLVVSHRWADWPGFRAGTDLLKFLIPQDKSCFVCFSLSPTGPESWELKFAIKRLTSRENFGSSTVVLLRHDRAIKSLKEASP